MCCTIVKSQIPYDKQLHIYAGATIGVASASVVPNPEKAFLAGIITTGSSAVLKEVYDQSIKKSRFDPLDMAATIVGGAVTSYIIFKIRKSRVKKYNHQ